MLWAPLSPTLGSEGGDLGTVAQIAAKVLPGGDGGPGALIARAPIAQHPFGPFCRK